jgi:hypothetical protein
MSDLTILDRQHEYPSHAAIASAKDPSWSEKGCCESNIFGRDNPKRGDRETNHGWLLRRPELLHQQITGKTQAVKLKRK